jgi:hypothetical protein
VAVRNIFFIDDRVQDKEALFSAIVALAKNGSPFLEHGLNQSSFHKFEKLVSSWLKQFPLKNCCT